MSRKTLKLTIGLVVAAVVLLLVLTIVRSLAKKEIFCGLEENRFRIPSLFVEEMKGITREEESLWIHSVFVKNDSHRMCVKPVVTIKFTPSVIGYVLNGTDADPRSKEQWIHIRDESDLILMPEKLAPGTFVDITVWTNAPNMLGESAISFSSGNDFEIRTEYVLYRNNEERFKQE
jgi:hypothetical protein